MWRPDEELRENFGLAINRLVDTIQIIELEYIRLGLSSKTTSWRQITTFSQNYHLNPIQE